ncbi:MAG: DUF1430 domain-containing protein [Lachnospiraceae bacterium]|nr:DUF1430 domain-containing protein [Lachnospiraceae bacterium]
MKRNKLIIFGVLFFIGLLFSNEMYIQYLSYLNSNYYYVSFYPEDGQEMEMLEEVEQTAIKHNLQVFFMVEETKSTRNQQFQIYASDRVREYLEKEEKVYENRQGSLFSGNVTVEYNSFYDLNAETIQKYPEGFMLIGEYDDMYHFKQELIDKYAGGFPHFDGYNSLEDIQGMVCAIWLIIAVVILLVEYYFISLEKKEIFVRFTMGEGLKETLGKCILRDAVIMLSVFLIEAFFNYLVCGGLFEFGTMFVVTILIIAIMAFFYLKLLWYDVSEVFSNKKISKETIIGNYLVKAIVLFLVICIAASNVAAITQWLKYAKEGELFERQKGAKQVQFHHDDDLCEYGHDCEWAIKFDGPKYLEYLLYLKYERDGKSGSVQHYTYVGLNNDKDFIPLVYISSCNKEYLMGKLPEITEYKEDTLYILAPKKVKCTEEEQENLFGWFGNDIGKDSDKYDKVFIEYEDDLDITALAPDNELGSDIFHNPIIAFENIKVKDIPTLTEVTDYDIFGFYRQIFMHTNIEEVEAFLEECNICDKFDFYMEDVWDNYTNTLTSLRRLATISIIIIVLLLSLFIFVNQTFISMLYNGNGIEIAIKKVSGYSTLERFRNIILADCIVGIVAIGAACAVCKIFSLCNLLYVIALGVLCIIIDLLLISYNCHKMDKERIQKILKGGCL